MGLVLFVFSASLYPANITFEATVDRNRVVLGGSVQLGLTFHNTKDVSAPRLGEIKGFESRYLGPSTMVSIVNGQVSSSITHNYQLIPLKEGKFILGPFSVVVGGKTYTSNSIRIEVVVSAVKQGKKQVVSPEVSRGLKEKIFLRMKPGKKKLYLNEITPLTIKLYINNLRVKDIQYPQFAHAGFSVEKYGKPTQKQENLNGVSYQVIEFTTRFSGVKPGKFILGPVHLKCNLIVKRQEPSSSDNFFNQDPFQNFFGGYETYPLDLKSAEIPVEVSPLPEANKPKNFSGAIGSFKFNLSASPRKVKVGDPITLKMTVSGKGNFDTVSAPKINAPNFKTYKAQVKTKNRIKLFAQVLIPKTDKINKIPKIIFNFFDPNKKSYRIIARGPLPIQVLPPAKEQEISIVEYPHGPAKLLKQETLGKGIIAIKESPGKLSQKTSYLYQNRIFWLFQLLPLIFLISFLMRYQRRERIRTDAKYAGLLQAPKKAKSGIKKAEQFLTEKKTREFYDAIFKTLQEYLGNKFHIPVGGITANTIEELPQLMNIEGEILVDLKEIFRDCDLVRYAPSEFGEGKMEETFKKMKKIINYFGRKKR